MAGWKMDHVAVIFHIFLLKPAFLGDLPAMFDDPAG